jgi:hypothetical protein
MLQWLIIHLHIVLAYGYEVLGGILIFYSSAVTETSMPQERKRMAHWILFGAIALIYAGFGIGLRYDEIQQTASATQKADQDRADLRGMRTSMDTRMDGVFSSFQSTYLQLSALSLDLRNMRVSLTQAIDRNDPQKIADFVHRAQAAQEQVDNLSHEVLALTMAPQIAQQLRDWENDRKVKMGDLHNAEWETTEHYRNRHRGDAEGLKSIEDDFQRQYDKADKEYRNKLSGIIATADFIRKEMLQQIPPQQQLPEDKKQEQAFAQAKEDPEALDRDNTPRYLENLAKRVPPPK